MKKITERIKVMQKTIIKISKRKLSGKIVISELSKVSTNIATEKTVPKIINSIENAAIKIELILIVFILNQHKYTLYIFSINSIIVTKFPYPNIQGLFWKILKQKQPDKFMQFYMDKARRELIQKVLRGVRFKGNKVDLWSPDIRVLNAKLD